MEFNQKIKSRMLKNSSLGSLKNIKIPKKDEKLAEFIGILLGDGNIHCYKKGKKIGTYMVRIAGDSIKDFEYLTKHVSNLCEDLFGVKTKLYKQKGSSELMVIMHSRLIVDFLRKMGLRPGNKIDNQSTIPRWVWKNNKYLKACIRGLIDTDGSVYELKPQWPGLYQINFENRNITLLKDLREAFLKLDFKISNICGKRTKEGTKIYLTRKDQIEKFYKEIGFSNPKHIVKLEKIRAP